MDSSEDKNYALAFFNSILVLLLAALILCAAAFWFSNYERSFAIANTGASVGIFLAALSARSAKSVGDRALVVLGLLCSVGFQVWSMATA